MGRNEELGTLCGKLMDVAKQGHLSLRREGGFRLVEEIQPLIPEPVLDQLEKGLPVGTGVQILAAVGGLYQITIIADIRRYIVEGFCPQEKLGLRPAEPAEGQMAVELRIIVIAGEVHIVTAALRVYPESDRDGLDQRGFADAVLSIQEGDGVIDRKLVKILQTSDVERIAARIDIRPVQPDPV